MKQYTVDQLRSFFSTRDRDVLLMALTSSCPYHVERNCTVPVLHNLRQLGQDARGAAIDQMTEWEKGDTLEKCVQCAFRWQPIF